MKVEICIPDAVAAYHEFAMARDAKGIGLFDTDQLPEVAALLKSVYRQATAPIPATVQSKEVSK